jgi:hypothetical protein
MRAIVQRSVKSAMLAVVLAAGCSQAALVSGAIESPAVEASDTSPGSSSPSGDAFDRREAPEASSAIDEDRPPIDENTPAAAGDFDTGSVPEPTRHPFHEPIVSLALPKSAPARRHANLSPGECMRELRRQKLPMRPSGHARGVASEVRVDGPIHGVKFVTPGRKSPYGVLDCRLALTLASLAEVLSEHDVVRVRIDNMYRPKAHLPGSRKRSQHAYGLALDVPAIELSDGRVLDVERDFHGGIGEPVCGPDATAPDDVEAAILLRNIVCDVVRRGLFHHVLTPNYNAAHRNHFHLDIKRDEVRVGVH